MSVELKQDIIKVKIVSGSMEPLIKTGEIVNVRKLQANEKMIPLHCYVFKALDQQFTCHYFLRNSKFEPGKLLFSSLATGELDAPVSREEVFGTVIDKKVGPWLIFRQWLTRFFIK